MSEDWRNWMDGTAYVDDRGWIYKVLPGINGDSYRARYCKPHTAGWHGVHQLLWRDTSMEAQRDLDELARRKSWKVC